MDIIILTSVVDDPKLIYVLDFVFVENMGLNYEVVSTIDAFQRSSFLKINYSDRVIPEVLSIEFGSYFSDFSMDRIPTLTSEAEIESQFFKLDLFAMVFYLLARVEEYNPLDLDNHKRYKSSNSCLAKKDLLHIPIIDLAIIKLKEHIESFYSLEIKQFKQYQFKSTIDIDHIFAYKAKRWITKAGSLFKDVAKLNVQRIKDRFKKKDPYDRLEDIVQWHNDLKVDPCFFVLTTLKNGQYDRSLNPNNSCFKDKISSLSKTNKIGIHPSYQSNTDSKIVERELNKLQEIISKNITISRQHFLLLSMPETYRNLIALGIKEDYSMGYADVLGYRSGTSQSFLWYDLEQDECTDLRLFSFQMMDVTLKNYLGYSPDIALVEMKKHIDLIRKVNGVACLIWHNSSFYDQEGWSGWEEIYNEILDYAK